MHSKQAAAILIVIALFAASAHGNDSQALHYLQPEAGDCVNTFMLKMNLVASYRGYSFGEFEGERLLAVRVNDSPCLVRFETQQADGSSGVVQMSCISSYGGQNLTVMESFPPAGGQ